MRLGKFSVLLFTFLLACSVATATKTDVLNGRVPSTLESKKKPDPSRVPSASATIFPTNIPSQTPSPGLTVTIKPNIPIICTPLKGYSLDELPDILSRGFIAPRLGKDDGHHGLDFAHWRYKERDSLEKVEIQSVFPGLVAAVIEDKWPYGNFTIIETPIENLSQKIVDHLGLTENYSLYHLYAHMLEKPVGELGLQVSCGQKLGQVGNTGWSGNPHLHFETRVGPSGAIFESMMYYTTQATVEERENYERWRFSGIFIPVDPLELLTLLGEDS